MYAVIRGGAKVVDRSRSNPYKNLTGLVPLFIIVNNNKPFLSSKNKVKIFLCKTHFPNVFEGVHHLVPPLLTII